MRDKLWLLVLVLTLPVVVIVVTLVRDEIGGNDEVKLEEKLDEIDELLTKLNQRDEAERLEEETGLGLKRNSVPSVPLYSLVPRGWVKPSWPKHWLNFC